MDEIVKHINDTNASYRPTEAGDAKNTDLFLDNDHYEIFKEYGELIKFRLHKHNLAQSILFIASILPRKFDQGQTHVVVEYSNSFVFDQLAILDAVFTDNGKPVDSIIQEWTARKDVPQKNGKIDKRFYFNGLLSDIKYIDHNGIEQETKFIIRNYFAGGYSDLHIKKSENGIFDLWITNALEPHDDGKEDDLEDIDSSHPNDGQPLQQIFYGAPGTGKSFAIEEQTKDEDVIRTTFHPDSDYSTFVGCYKPTTIDVPMRDVTGKVIVEKGEPVTEKRIVYEFVNQAFLQAYVGAWKKMAGVTIDKAQKQYLVIEEINRGNCAQIFGDLFQLLDRNRWGFSEYPIKADADMKKQIKKQLTGLTFINDLVISILFGGKDIVGQVLEGDILLLPPNLFIWATMNTSDQSLFPIDSAFKRRWDWKYVPIANAELDWVIEVNGKKYDWWDFLKKINALIGEKTHSEDKKLGYFFCKTQNGIIDAETFVGKVIFYLWNDVFKDFEFEDDVFDDTDDTENNKLTFDKFYKPDATVQESKVEVFLTNLKVELANVVEATMESEDGSDESNYSGYSLNGNKMTLGNIAMTVVQNYANNNPSMSAQAIRDYFINLCQGIGISHVVETEAEYHLRDGQPSQKRSASEITLPNGEKLYVSTQWRARNENDNFIRFMDIVNNNGLGIISQ